AMSPWKRPQPVEPARPGHVGPAASVRLAPPIVSTEAESTAPYGGSVGATAGVASMAALSQRARAPADASRVVPTMYHLSAASTVAPVSGAFPLPGFAS